MWEGYCIIQFGLEFSYYRYDILTCAHCAHVKMCTMCTFFQQMCTLFHNKCKMCTFKQEQLVLYPFLVMPNVLLDTTTLVYIMANSAAAKI